MVLLDSPVTMPREEIEAQCPVVVIDDPKTPGGGSGALTAISLSAFDLGFEAATLLQDMIERGSRTRRGVVLPTHLVVRNSTGPVVSSSSA